MRTSSRSDLIKSDLTKRAVSNSHIVEREVSHGELPWGCAWILAVAVLPLFAACSGSAESGMPATRMDLGSPAAPAAPAAEGSMAMAPGTEAMAPAANAGQGSAPTGGNPTEGNPTGIGIAPSSPQAPGQGAAPSTPAAPANTPPASPPPAITPPETPPPAASPPPASPAPATPPSADPAAPVAPPGTGTFGQQTPGGRGGAVIRVTTLNLTGPGSLSAALATQGPRIIVFEVGGNIDLAQGRITIREPFVTIAGQTAPSPGINLIRGGLTVLTHDVRIEHLRVRMGDAGAAAGAGFEPDVTTDTAEAHDIVFNHVSVAWGVDENLSVSGPRFDGAAATSRAVTIQNSIIAEGLLNSVHEKGAHSMGTLIHDYCSDVAVIGNLYAHNNERNPWFKGFATGVIVNNVVYDPGRWAIRLGAVLNEWTDSGITPEGPRVSVVGNVLLHGVDTPPEREFVGSNSNGAAFLQDNLAFDRAGAPALIKGDTVAVLNERPSWPNGLIAAPASSVLEQVLASAGARPKDRDAVDQRIVADVRARTGRIIDSQNDVGGYPTLAATRRTLDVPADVDTWLRTLATELE